MDGNEKGLAEVCQGLKEKFSVNQQLAKLVEECREYQTAWAKFELSPIDAELALAMIDEIADLIIVLGSIQLHLPSSIAMVVKRKLKKASRYLL